MADPLRTGAELIAAERRRQIDDEGWDEAHDDDHVDAEMVDAASCYADPNRYYDIPPRWPWDGGDWKPRGRVRDLVRAGALIAAEIARLRRRPSPPMTSTAQPARNEEDERG